MASEGGVGGGSPRDVDDVYAALRDALTAREGALVAEHTSRSTAFDTLCCEIAILRKIVVAEMGEEGRFEVERREAAATLTTLSRALVMNWETADAARRAALRPFFVSLTAFMQNGEEPRREPGAQPLLDMAQDVAPRKPPHPIHARPLPTPLRSLSATAPALPARSPGTSPVPPSNSPPPVRLGTSPQPQPQQQQQGPQAPVTPMGASAVRPTSVRAMPTSQPPARTVRPVSQPVNARGLQGVSPQLVINVSEAATAAAAQAQGAAGSLSPEVPRSPGASPGPEAGEDLGDLTLDAKKRFATIGGTTRRRQLTMSAAPGTLVEKQAEEAPSLASQSGGSISKRSTSPRPTSLRGKAPKALGGAIPTGAGLLAAVTGEIEEKKKEKEAKEKDKEREKEKEKEKEKDKEKEKEKEKDKEKDKGDDGGSLMRKLGWGKKSVSKERLPIPVFDNTPVDPQQDAEAMALLQQLSPQQQQQLLELQGRSRGLTIAPGDGEHPVVIKPRATPEGERKPQTPEKDEKEKDTPVVQPSIKPGSGTCPGASPLPEGASRREHIEHEIMTTEHSYVEGLRIALEIYEAPLRLQDPPIVIKEEIDKMFGNMRLLYNFHLQLLKGLTGKTETIGKVFVRMTPFFKNYTEYGKTFDEASGILQRLKKENPPFRAFLERQCRLHTDVVTLDHLASFLITPIQRIPRYNLLLTDLIKNTDEANQDMPNLKKALELMMSVAEAVNGSVKYGENINNLLRIQQSLTFPKDANQRFQQDFIQPHRQFIKEGEMIGILRGSKKSHVVLFLFNDSIIMAKRKGRAQLVFKTQVSLETVFVDDSKQTDGDLVSFSLQTPGKRIPLFCTRDERDSWMQTITRYRDDQMEREGQKMVIRLLQKAPSGTPHLHMDSSAVNSPSLSLKASPPHFQLQDTAEPQSLQLQQQQSQLSTECDLKEAKSQDGSEDSSDEEEPNEKEQSKQVEDSKVSENSGKGDDKKAEPEKKDAEQAKETRTPDKLKEVISSGTPVPPAVGASVETTVPAAPDTAAATTANVAQQPHASPPDAAKPEQQEAEAAKCDPAASAAPPASTTIVAQQAATNEGTQPIAAVEKGEPAAS